MVVMVMSFMRISVRGGRVQLVDLSYRSVQKLQPFKRGCEFSQLVLLFFSKTLFPLRHDFQGFTA